MLAPHAVWLWQAQSGNIILQWVLGTKLAHCCRMLATTWQLLTALLSSRTRLELLPLYSISGVQVLQLVWAQAGLLAQLLGELPALGLQPAAVLRSMWCPDWSAHGSTVTELRR